MKLFARINYERESSGAILRSFFDENVSVVKRIQKVDDCILLEVDITEEKSATELINAISDSDIVELLFGKPFDNNNADDIASEEVIEDFHDFRELTNATEHLRAREALEHNAEPEEDANGKSDETEPNAKSEEDANGKRNETESNAKFEEDANVERDESKSNTDFDEPDDMPSLICKVAENAKNFDDFVDRVIETFDLKKKTDFIKVAIKATIQKEGETWTVIKDKMKDLGYWINSSEELCIKKRIRSKVKKGTPTTRDFIFELVKYKDYFSPRFVIDCFPPIPEFDEKLTQMDKNASIEEKVEYILVSMGIENQPGDRKPLIEKLVKYAVKNRITNISKMTECIVSCNQAFARASTMEFINSFLRRNNIASVITVEVFINACIKAFEK